MAHWITVGIEESFWRAIAVFRVASVVYAALLLVGAGGYSHPVAGWVVIGVMAFWTVTTTYGYAAFRGRPLLVADLAVALGCLLATLVVQDPSDAGTGSLPITATWVAGPVLAWGVYGGRRAGAVAAAVVSMGDLWLRVALGFYPASAAGPAVLHDILPATVSINGEVLLFMAGVVVGHVASLAKESEVRMQRAIELETIGRERERLARGIHDSVLQVLALVQRRGAEIGGEAADLGRLAGEQEAVLREMVRSAPPPEPRVVRPDRGARPEQQGRSELPPVDLCALLRRHGAARVTISTPATPIPLDPAVGAEITAAVGAALDNVRAHCGDAARAWILAENEPDRVIVTVRDDGPGIPEGRLEEAAAAGRMGVALSIRGRVADLGGNVVITSSSTGTEIEFTVPSRAGH